MAEESTPRHLRAVRGAAPRIEIVADESRAEYWARLQALRAERQRLRAG